MSALPATSLAPLDTASVDVTAADSPLVAGARVFDPTGLSEPAAGPTWPRRVRDISGFAARLAALCWFWAIIWMALWSCVLSLVGWAPTVVTTGSMSPALPPGAIIQVDDGIDIDTLLPGAVITFDNPAIDGMRVTHRITGVEQVDGILTGFRTKGDANSSPDSTIVPVANVQGVARLVVPGAGLPHVWATQGQWAWLALFLSATAGAGALAVDTIWRFLSSSARRREGSPSRRSRRLRVTGVAVAATALVGTSSSSAAFNATTENALNTFGMTDEWHLDSIDRQTPVAHWRLGELSDSVVYTDDFETFNGYNALGSGQFTSSTDQARSGSTSGLKTEFNDPNGGWKALPNLIGNEFSLTMWVYRPSGFAGGSIDRLGLENADFNGYTLNIDHNANTINIDRRTAGVANALATNVAFDPPEDAWYRVQLTRMTANLLTLNIYDNTGVLLATTSATDATTTSFDRITVRGGWDYYIDDLTVTIPASVAIDRIGTLDGQYTGTPMLDATGLVNSNTDTAVDFDGVNDIVSIGDDALINLTDRSERTVELWIKPDTVNGRQMIYEEGGASNGMNIYLDESTLYGHAWSASTNWSNTLVTTSPVAEDERIHVALVLDATDSKALELFVNGVSVQTAFKQDANPWSRHGADGAIGGLNGNSKMHDGNISGGGYEFNGTIDEVVLYNSALTSAVIAGRHAAGS